LSDIISASMNKGTTPGGWRSYVAIAGKAMEGRVGSRFFYPDSARWLMPIGGVLFCYGKRFERSCGKRRRVTLFNGFRWAIARSNGCYYLFVRINVEVSTVPPISKYKKIGVHALHLEKHLILGCWHGHFCQKKSSCTIVSSIGACWWHGHFACKTFSY
jgi:hypothetical protein